MGREGPGEQVEVGKTENSGARREGRREWKFVFPGNTIPEEKEYNRERK